MLKISTKKSDLVPEIIDVFQNEIGTLYFLKNIVISEINDGVHINYSTSLKVFEAIKSFYIDCESFGYISNRINDYSITPLDFGKFHDHFPNLKVFATVTYSELNKMNTDLEKRFCKVPYKNFTDLISAKQWVINNL